MMTLRRSTDRGHANFGWLDSKHSFSFGEYYDPQYMGFGSLRVINEDRVEAGKGFGTHGHRDMEIVSYVIDGALEHKDSLGTGSVLRAGDVQRMSAGTGVQHSEFNHFDNALVHFLQIWVIPERDGIAPEYEEKHFSRDNKLNRLCLVASRDARLDSLRIHQDIDVYASLLQKGQRLSHAAGADRKFWVQVVRGSVDIDAQQLNAGDGVALAELGANELIEITATNDAEFLLFDMA
ncbi:MAG: pirin family protein [Pseudomonadota bacterium]